MPARMLGARTMLPAAPSRARLLSAVLAAAFAAAAPPVAAAGAERSVPSARARSAIVGGGPAPGVSLESLAYILDIRGSEVATCSGTVLAPRLVLTAGHCAIGPAPGYRVITGAVDRESGRRLVSGVSQIIMYPGFTFANLHGDAALLVLSSPTSAPAIRLATPGLRTSGAEDTLAGWGKTGFGQAAPIKRLRWAEVAEQPAVACARQIVGFDPTIQLCASAVRIARAAACGGDSGGPLLAPSAAGGSVEIGIESFGSGRCSTRRPDVFTRVDAISTWVRETADALTFPAPTAAAALPDFTGIYATQGRPSSRIAIAVGAPGQMVDGVHIQLPFRCRRGRIHRISARAVNLAPRPIVDHFARVHLTFGAGAGVQRGEVSIEMHFDALGEVRATLSGRFRLGDPSLGLCTVTGLRFAAAIR